MSARLTPAQGAIREEARHSAAARRFHPLPLVFALCAGLAFLSLTDGGRAVREAAPVERVLDQFAARFGFGIRQIELTGYRHTDPVHALNVITRDGEQSVLGLGFAGTQQALLQLPWVASATIKRVWPDRLVIDLQERAPVAVWQRDANARDTAMTFLASDGRVLGPAGAAAIAAPRTELLRIAGAGAPEALGEVRALVRNRPDLAAHVHRFIRISGMRWDLELNNGARVLLPALAPADVLESALVARLLHELIDEPAGTSTVRVDARVPGRVVVRRARARVAAALPVARSDAPSPGQDR
ncbi:MAG: FtsQ-type POTRA domain-containing protein [Pseudomonadota bacterium]